MKNIFILLFVVICTIPCISQTSNSTYLWLTNGQGEEVGGSYIAYPDEQQGVFVTGCTFTGPFAFAKLYVVFNTRLTSSQLNGSTLIDISGSPNTVHSFISCGYVQDELIYAVSSSTPPASYDIILDYNNNEKFDSNIDAIFGDGAASAFSVTAYDPIDFLLFPPTETLTPEDLKAASNLVNKIKEDAGKTAIKLEELYNKYKTGMWSLLGLELGLQLFISGFLPFTMAVTNTYLTWDIHHAGHKAAESAIERYTAIEKDPPRNDFSQLAILDSVDLTYPNSFQDSLSIFFGKNHTVWSLEQRVAAAELITLERLQGAVLADSAQAVYKQALYLKSLLLLQNDLSILRKLNWSNLQQSLLPSALSQRLPTDTLRSIQEQLLETGFSPEQIKFLTFYNFSAEEIEEEKQNILSFSVDQYEGLTYQQLFDRSIIGEDSIQGRIISQIDLIDSLLQSIKSHSNFSFPEYILAGPDTGSVRNMLSFSYQPVTTPASSTTGIFYNDPTKNINTNSFTINPTLPGYYLIYRSATNSSGTSGSYQLVEVNPSNSAPRITGFSPASNISINSKDTLLKFKVTAVDPENDNISYSWFVNGNLYAEGKDSILFPALTSEDAFYHIWVEVDDAATGNYRALKEWDVVVKGDPSLFANRPTNKNATYWYFGGFAGLQFGAARPIALTNGILDNFEGVSTVSDSSGNLMFYTNGRDVYNRQHAVMSNGTGLISNSSATQGALSIPYPGKPNKYLIFTVGEGWGTFTDFAYNVVDMSLAGGLGAVEVKNKILMKTSSEKLTAVYHQNQRHIWVLTLDPLNKRVIAYLITENGVSSNPVISTFPSPLAIDGPGYMKISPNGKLLATADFKESFHLFDFNSYTGEVTNPRRFPLTTILEGFGSYGIEFSPNSRFIYVADHGGNNVVCQFDLNNNTINSVVDNRVVFKGSRESMGALQLGPDGRIYIAQQSGFLSVINKPDMKGADCGFSLNGVYLNGRQSWLGLPGFVSSIFTFNQITYEGNCMGFSTRFKLDLNSQFIQSVSWNFGDNSSPDNTASGLNPEHTYTKSGSYYVSAYIRYTNSSIGDSLFTSIEIKAPAFSDIQIRYIGENPVCGDSAFISSSRFANEYRWYRNDSLIADANSMSIWATKNGNYRLETGFVNSCSAKSKDSLNISFHKPKQYYIDADHDGYGSTTTAMVCASAPPVGYSTDNTDCNDDDANIHEGQQYYLDEDQDGYGSTATAMVCSTTAPVGYATSNTDCNDDDAGVHEGRIYYLDADRDGYGSIATAIVCSATAPAGYATNNSDCNDDDANIHEAQQYYVDADHDGYGSTTTAMLCSSTAPVGFSTDNTDCNDDDVNVHEDQQYYVDADQDGYGSTTTSMICSPTAPVGYATNNTDCNDDDASIHEGQRYYVDADQDGYGSTTTAMLCSAIAPAGYATNNTDCNDSDATVQENCACNLTAACNSNTLDNILYFGYTGDQTETITIKPSGGVGPYTIKITMNRPLLCNQINDAGDEVWLSAAGGTTVNNSCPVYPGLAALAPVSIKSGVAAGNSYAVTVTLMADATITATITDASGCETTCTKFVHADDVRCFAGKAGKAKVTLCHQTGSSKNPCVKICVDDDAVAEHLAHGDFIGACTANCLPQPSVTSNNTSVSYQSNKVLEIPEKPDVKIMPNPARGGADFVLRTTGNANETIQIQVLDMYGKVINTAKGSANGDYRFGRQFLSGVYIVRVFYRNEVSTYKIVKTK